MAIQPMALGVNNPEINAVSALAAGQQARQSFDMNNVQIAKAGLETIGSIALGAMGGNIDGQADPALFNQGLDYLAQQGVNVDQFRDRADLAPVIARSSMTALQQMQMAQDERSYQLALDKFEQDVMQAAQGPAPTADMLNFQMAQQNPAFAEYQTAQNAPNPPSGVAEYNFYAEQEKAAGREPMTVLEYEQTKKGGGLTVTTNPDGTTTVQQGGSARPLTEGQSKDTVYATRASAALPSVEKYEQNLLSLGENLAGNVPLIGNYMQSEDYQLGRDAGLDYLAAILRKDTGAAVTPSEENWYGRIFLPQPGDKPAVLDAKRERRALAVEAIKAGMPQQALDNMADALATRDGITREDAPTQATPAAAPSPAASAPAGEPARPMTQADYDAIPSGGLFIDPDDGQTYKKP